MIKIPFCANSPSVWRVVLIYELYVSARPSFTYWGHERKNHNNKCRLFLKITLNIQERMRCQRTLGLIVSLTTVSKQPLLLKAFLQPLCVFTSLPSIQESSHSPSAHSYCTSITSWEPSDVSSSNWLWNHLLINWRHCSTPAKSRLKTIALIGTTVFHWRNRSC